MISNLCCEIGLFNKEISFINFSVSRLGYLLDPFSVSDGSVHSSLPLAESSSLSLMLDAVCSSESHLWVQTFLELIDNVCIDCASIIEAFNTDNKFILHKIIGFLSLFCDRKIHTGLPGSEVFHQESNSSIPEKHTVIIVFIFVIIITTNFVRWFHCQIKGFVENFMM